MKRIYEAVILEHIKRERQMLFIMGPRQVGKTTTTQKVGLVWKKYHYYNWDRDTDRKLIRRGVTPLANQLQLTASTKPTPLLIFDELHKYRPWKLFLKGLYDSYPHQAHILATGSAKLNVYRRGGDSLMGRYFSFRFHPLSIAEIVDPSLPKGVIRKKPKPISAHAFEKLIKFGGYPDPFINGTVRYYNRWKKLRLEKLFREDIRDLTRVQELDQLQLMARLLQAQIGQNTSYDSLAKKVRVSSNTIRNWFGILKDLYYCFEVRPWSKNITRSLLKEPKYYLWDWSLCADLGALAENFVASHLLKAVHFWTDYGFGDYELYYLRDKDQREVDFLIVKDQQPWILVEVKNSTQGLSPALGYFQQMTGAPHAFQLSFTAPFVAKNCFEIRRPTIVPASTFLSQLI
ncbi:MAG TPA: ATP-binding protein [Candidatus Babeliales bacterium]|nr:ATP-binding protein [Candidatus Babeliales bacterium]